MLFGQKDHAHAVFTRQRQLHTHRPVVGYTAGRHFLAVQGIGQLNQDARSVTHQGISTHRTTVVQVFQNFERAAHNVVRTHSFDVCHKAHATSVVLVCGRVQAVVLQMLDFGGLGHHRLLRRKMRLSSDTNDGAAAAKTLKVAR